MDAFLTADGLIALVTLTFLEVVLGVDNVIFISILVGKLPKEQQQRGRTLGLAGAMGMRILLLLSLTWIMRLTAAALQRVQSRFLRARPHPHQRRPVPAVEGDRRDSRQARRRGRARHPEGEAVVCRDHRADHAARHHLLARLGHHRGRHGQRHLHHDHGGRRRGRHHDVLGQSDRRLRDAAPDGEGARACHSC